MEKIFEWKKCWKLSDVPKKVVKTTALTFVAQLDKWKVCVFVIRLLIFYSSCLCVYIRRQLRCRQKK